MKDFERIDRLEKDFANLLLAINEASDEMAERAKTSDETLYTKNSRMVSASTLQTILLRFKSLTKSEGI